MHYAPHFMVDCYDARGSKTESFRINASVEGEAIKNALLFVPESRAHRFAIRAVSKSDDAVVYRSDRGLAGG